MAAQEAQVAPDSGEHARALHLTSPHPRDEALVELERPFYGPDERENDLDRFCKEFRITRANHEGFVRGPKSSYYDCPNWEGCYRLLKKNQAVVARMRVKRIKVYS